MFIAVLFALKCSRVPKARKRLTCSSESESDLQLNSRMSSRAGLASSQAAAYGAPIFMTSVFISKASEHTTLKACFHLFLHAPSAAGLALSGILPARLRTFKAWECRSLHTAPTLSSLLPIMESCIFIKVMISAILPNFVTQCAL
ncbi:uncharacterized protein BCR38DRAFT_190356 [Pseudomassariella vexata]|uniref:Uncharacterized protein n=1 Tax=Pseudomassariella vexata TaxID=1141098 RepID=A0A1Y2E0Q0_9PEZI|nr:uncharacterized protein BCR38DRAFT_190356 [Pseudomassariella vexata]ORY65057.1 hypothetical protein BCR38DRAFT_190356 [Pseudomassariella vexata]